METLDTDTESTVTVSDSDDNIEEEASEVDDDIDKTETESEDTESDEDEIGDVWLNIVSGILEEFQEDMDARVEELAEDMSKEEAQEMALAEFLPDINEKLQQKFISFSVKSHQLKKDPIYQKIMETARAGRQADGMDWEESVSYAVSKRKLLLARVLNAFLPTFADEREEDSDWFYTS